MPKGVHGNHARASRQHRWKPGGKLASNGYVRVRLGQGHPLADPNGYGYEHLVVWVAAGRSRPQRHQIIHHINGDKTDNRIENLEVMTRGAHNALHLAERLEGALRFYAADDPSIPPNEGPWGANSKDFGNKARAALATDPQS